METSTILVVDDNAENRILVRETLQDEGYEVLLAESGPRALEMFRRDMPACVLLDVRMPGMDGLMVCQEIRKLDSGVHTPIIFLTALRDIDTFERALEVGGTDFLTKPVRPTELVVRVHTLIELHRSSAQLRDLYETVRRQRDDLMRLTLQKERLAAFVVHDLKSPVNAIDLHAQILLRDRALSESSRDSARHIRDEARELSRLLMTLLDVSKADEGRLTPRYSDVGLPDLARSVETLFEARAKGAHLTLEFEIAPVSFRMDRDLMHRVVANLMENAIRHAPQRSVVRLEAQVAEGGLTIRVIDRGKGVPEEMRTKVFDAFTQVEGSGRRQSRTGRGLGLTFCRLAVEAHGGAIRVEDGAPGAIFVVSIPEGSSHDEQR